MRQHERNFCLVTVGQIRILATMQDSHLQTWKDGSPQPVEIVNPKMYIEAPGRTAGEIQTAIMPLQHLPISQHGLWVHPAAIDIYDMCEKGVKQLYVEYQDAVSRWNAHCSGIVAPTQKDLFKIHQGGGDRGQQ